MEGHAEQRRNWAGNYEYGASGYVAPRSTEEVQEITARSSRVKALGTRHSFNGIADTDGTLLSLEKLNRVLELDRAKGRVTVEGGIRYGELCRYLDERGYALPNLASLPHITVAGACATATHGSGDRNGSLATSVHAMEIVTASGEKIALSRDDEDGLIAGAIVGLGGLGIVTSLTLNVLPAFRMAQTVYEELPLARLKDRFDEIFSAGYSVSLFTDWRQASFNQVWLKRTVAAEAATPQSEETFHGAVRAVAPRHPVPGHAADSCSEQLGVPGPWYERLPHFRMDFTPSAGAELQSEYFVPRAAAYDALLAVDGLRARIAPLLYISEVRSIAADDLWMSPCYGQDSVAIHFTWKPEGEAVRQVLPLIEQALEPYRVRPHWGKLFDMQPRLLCPLYERLPDFEALVNRFDPSGKFSNALLERYVRGAAKSTG
ncbi:FAD-binding protein [Mycobacterium sp. E3298]|uniref:FAD-binding protein n=1 Tax=Mycobacterium sp. E3298 TaxID=1856865 RepID=UPI0007FE773B|nr:FAD-binding protein [Mycobacterium sp. E3298]OBG74225.1 FAD-binding protein [Mycobacterium sp. E3298]